MSNRTVMTEASLFFEIGHLIEVIGDADYFPALTELLRSAVPYDYNVVFAYMGAFRPSALFDNFPASKHKVFVEDYLVGPYLLDPFYLAAKRHMPAGVYRLRELAPDRFYQGEYFRSYYTRTGLAEEVGFFVDVTPQTDIVVSLMRAKRAFSARDMRVLHLLSPVVLASLRRHWSGVTDSRSFLQMSTVNETTLEHTFANFGRGVLTPREREIVEHTLKGNSAQAVGDILDIKPGTVRIHRRNVYAKLRISSQGELFSLFLQSAKAPEAQ